VTLFCSAAYLRGWEVSPARSFAASSIQVTDLGIARDTAANVEAALDRAIAEGADVLLTTGVMRCL